MRYSFEFKVKCVEMYERGEYPETPNGITTRKFRLYTKSGAWKRFQPRISIFIYKKTNIQYN